MTIDTLRQVPLFESLDNEAAGELCHLLEGLDHKAGTFLFRAGDEGDAGLAWPAPSETDCPNIAETPVVIRPQVKINENLLPAIKGHNPRSTFSGCQRMKLP